MLQKVQGTMHVIEVSECCLEGGLAYIVMERGDASFLQTVEAALVVTEVVLARFFREMLQGLSALHDMGIVHRDVKPANFLCFGPGATVKLCDFGLATTLPRDGATGICGTPPYMAPEMLRHMRYDGRVDVWSLGVMVYVFLLGEYPYMPAECSSSAMKAAIAEGTRAPSFEPRRRLQERGLRGPSPAAAAFLRGALGRRPQERLSAKEALKSAFLSGEASSSSLMPALGAAKSLGIFDRSEAAPRFAGLEHRLAALQQRAPAGAKARAEALALGDARLRSTGSTCASLASPGSRARKPGSLAERSAPSSGRSTASGSRADSRPVE